MIPAPTHLKDITKQLKEVDINDFNLKDRFSEYSFIGKVNCTCGCESLQFLQPDEEIGPCYLKVKCPICLKEYLLFDANFHGWDGWICHDEEAASEERPEVYPLECEECSNNVHEVVVIIDSQGKEDFMEEAGDDFDIERWQDAFEWITIDIRCNKCGKVTKELVSYETM